MSIRAAIAAALDADPNIDAEQLAKTVLAQARKADLLPLVVEEVRLQQRHSTRRIERSVRIKQLAARLGQSTIPQVAAEPDQRRYLLDLLGRTWSLGDGTTVAIGQATLPEIRQRLEMLRRQRDGLDQSIQVLEAVEAELVRTGANCLDDLMTPEAAA